MKFFREKYGRKNVTPTKVLDSYEGCEQFVLSVGTAYLLEGALEFWGMVDLSATPTKNIIPPNLRNNKEKKDYFDAAVQSFITSYVVHDPDDADVLPDQLPCSDGAPDRVRYSMFKHLSTIVRIRISYVILCALSSLELIASLTSNVFAKYMQH